MKKSHKFRPFGRGITAVRALTNHAYSVTVVSFRRFHPPIPGVMGPFLFELAGVVFNFWLIKGDQKTTYESWDGPGRISALLSR